MPYRVVYGPLISAISVVHHGKLNYFVSLPLMSHENFLNKFWTCRMTSIKLNLLAFGDF